MRSPHHTFVQRCLFMSCSQLVSLSAPPGLVGVSVLGALFDRMLAQVAEGKSGGVARDAVQEVRALYAL